MLILVIGKSYSTGAFSDFLAQNKNNIVFTTAKSDIAIFTDINPNNPDEIKEFVQANEISLIIVSDIRYVDLNYQSILNETECCVLCPNSYSAKLCTNLASGKKFAYKNKVQTPKFAIFEKSLAALESLTEFSFPVIISPEKYTPAIASYNAETKSKAKNRVEFLFQSGNKKILIENFVSGVTYTKYLISDGTHFLNLQDAISYFDEASTNNLSYINSSVKDKIDNELVPKILDAFFEEGIDYQGILGITFYINKNEIYFAKFKPFFDDIDVNIFLQAFEGNLENLLHSASIGEFANQNITINKNAKYSISINKDGEFITKSAATMTKAIDFVIFDKNCEKEIKEAVSNWKN